MSQHDLYGIYGVSGFGREVLPVARAMLQQTLPREGYELVFVDDAHASSRVNGHRVLGYDEFVAAKASAKHVNVAIASSKTRRMLFERCARDGIATFDIRAPNAMLLDDLSVGPGSILCPFVTLTSNIRIGRGFHANIYSYVAHDCVIGDYVTFAPAVKCNGNVVVEDDVYLGTGCVLRQGQPGAPLVIGAGAVVGMGAVVTKSVPPNTTVVGNPARPLQKES
jgi:sugar O-acyltransferase (sialic acid O-acetyltransferase NeuD family)